MIIPFLFELLFCDERFSTAEIISVLFRLVSVFVSVPSFKREDSSAKGILCCIALFVMGGAANIVTRLYSRHPGVCSDSSFCFWTNIIIIPLVFIEILHRTGIKEIIRESRKIDKIDYVCVIGSMMMNNLVMLLSIHAVRLISATIYSVLSGSLTIVFTTLSSVLLYKEKLRKEACTAVIFSLLAIILSVL